MRRDRSFQCEGLEPRRLLTKGHLVHAEVVVPEVLDGTLTVNTKQTLASQDYMGNTQLSTPVSGVLSGLGKVQGTWNEVADSLGDSLGDDALQLHNAQGSVTLMFSPSNHGKAHKTALGTSFSPLAQHVTGGTKGYNHASESGTITINTNASGKTVQSMTLSTTS